MFLPIVTARSIMQGRKELAKAFLMIEGEGDMLKFLEEILTENELLNLDVRWRLMKDLYRGETQRSIAKKYQISLCRITRGSKILKDKNAISLKLIKQMENK